MKFRSGLKFDKTYANKPMADLLIDPNNKKRYIVDFNINL